jgi:hypothetical protein
MAPTSSRIDTPPSLVDKMIAVSQNQKGWFDKKINRASKHNDFSKKNTMINEISV